MNKKYLLPLIFLIAFLQVYPVICAYEDFTTYTEVDPNTHITVAANELDLADLARNEDAYVYDDKGAGHFGDFEHLVDIQILSTSGAGSLSAPWGVSNNINDVLAWATGLYIRLNGGTGEIRLVEVNGGSFDTYAGARDTWYYLTIERSDTTLTCKIYSDASRTILVDTLSVTCLTTTYRYVYGCASYNSGHANAYDGDVDQLDLQEIVALDLTFDFVEYINLTSTLIAMRELQFSSDVSIGWTTVNQAGREIESLFVEILESFSIAASLFPDLSEVAAAVVDFSLIALAMATLAFFIAMMKRRAISA